MPYVWTRLQNLFTTFPEHPLLAAVLDSHVLAVVKELSGCRWCTLNSSIQARASEKSKQCDDYVVQFNHFAPPIRRLSPTILWLKCARPDSHPRHQYIGPVIKRDAAWVFCSLSMCYITDSHLWRSSPHSGCALDMQSPFPPVPIYSCSFLL